MDQNNRNINNNNAVEVNDDYFKPSYYDDDDDGNQTSLLTRPALSNTKSSISLFPNKSLLYNPSSILRAKPTMSLNADSVSVFDGNLDNIEADGDGQLESFISNSTGKSSTPTIKVFRNHSDHILRDGLGTEEEADENGDGVEQLLEELINDNKSMLGESIYSSNISTRPAGNDILDEFDFNITREYSDNNNDIDDFYKHKKHFFILSSAGKPIYSMHGSDEVITGYMGIIQTIISYFNEHNDDNLKSFTTSSNTRFTFLNQSPIILMAVSSSSSTTESESDLQLLQQLQFLYNFLLSTLSRPHILKVFTKRENFDLRKLLGRSDLSVLDSICNDLCNGLNPGLIIGGLQCLKLKKSIRLKLDQLLLSNRTPNLLYGLIVAPKGRLISILRPRRHSLHTSDLQLLFEMVFNTNTFKTSNDNSYSEEEFWVPICLPNFNLNGFLYCFIKFIDLSKFETFNDYNHEEIDDYIIDKNKIALILISADRNSFFEMREMSNNVINSMIMGTNNIYKEMVKSLFSPRAGILINVDIPTPLIRHFIYKSKKHIQYVFPEIDNCSGNLILRGKEDEKYSKIMYIYKKLHTIVLNHYNSNSQTSNFISYVKLKNSNNKEILGIVIITKNYELYLLTNDGLLDKNLLMKSCKKIINWCNKNEEKLFVCGGAIF